MTQNEDSDRIEFREFKLEELPDGRCHALVVLTWPRGHNHVGVAEAEDTETGHYRCAAEATARALELSVADIKLDVQSVRMLREADTNIVLVLLSYQLLGGIRQKLVGSCIVGERKPFRSVALAVLKATNRIIGNVISPPSN